MSSLTPRERILAVIAHEPADRLPTDIWATQEVWARLYAHFGTNDMIAVYDHLGIDGIIGIAPPYIGPELVVEGQEKDTSEEQSERGDSAVGSHLSSGSGYYVNEWGMGYRSVAYETGVYDEQVYYPLAKAETIDDLEAYAWPSPDWYDYSALPDLAAAYSDRAIMCGYAAVFYFHNLLRGLELSFMDPILKPDFTHHLIKRISDFFNEYHQRCFDAAGHLIDITQVTDDYGSQTGLLISPQMFDSFYRGPVQSAIDVAKSYGITVFHHDDGDLRPLLPRLTQMGIDVLNPIQWRCGNWDLTALKADYGPRLCFHGGVDNQQTLPFGTPDDVIAEVRWLKSTLGKDGTGFVIAPCHNIQANTPIENILAMYEAAADG
jgi:uroporphyrinogen decarboxylase